MCNCYPHNIALHINFFTYSLESGMNLPLQTPKLSGVMEAQKGVYQNKHQLAD